MTITAVGLMVGGWLWWMGGVSPTNTVRASTKSIRPDYAVFPADTSEMQAFQVLADSTAGREVLARIAYEFIQASPLTEMEARPWTAAGCGQDLCAHVLAYNYTDGGTVEGIVNLTRDAVLDVWTDEQIRPLATEHTLDTAVAIANTDKEVRAALGGAIQADDLMMVPMNIWLLDDACAQNWCVDLTFHDPADTGKIFHVTVDMDRQAVARTFYTRGRQNRPYRDLTPQRNAFSDGCHEQAGWSVCWQMTAHDGVEFYDAAFEGETIFSTAKIGQVEVWYPSWPGGYRDEIGHSATVPPYFDTVVEEVEDGFKVSQLFTEFTRWPNCICCYRYEQIMAFYMDGTFETRFVSHGPGCDDLSIYQPLWRIDLDLAGEEGDNVWVWRDGVWEEAAAEQELELISDTSLSPEGEKLATFDGDLHYRWEYEPNDPLGLDEAKMFLVSWNEREGENPILTGPANTYQPPRQWIDGDDYSGENVTLWYVPLMKTKKGGPWWCMPDPAPEMTPCESVLRAVPAGDLPDAEELRATATAIAVAQAQITPSPTPPPTRTPVPIPTTTPAPVDGDDARELIGNLGCTACHVIGDMGNHNKVGPDLSNIGEVAAERGEEIGISAEAYIRRSILYPNEYIAPECPNGPCLANVMPDYYGERVSAAQLETMVQYLAVQTDDGNPLAEATPTPRPIGAENSAPPVGSNVDNGSGPPLAFWMMIMGGVMFVVAVGAFIVGRRSGRMPPSE